MTDHELVRPLLALNAAGLLDPEEERRLRRHVEQCGECRGELEDLAQLAAGLRALPCLPPPAGLLARTQARIAADADRREGARLAAVAAAFTGVLLLSLAIVLRAALGDSGVLVWFAWSSISSVLGGAAAIVLASRLRHQRSAQ
jgi:predicted anti-sigma-YlaC factor YlaD